MDLDVHLVEGLLHPLDATGPLLDQVGHLSLDGSQGDDRIAWPERTTKQTAAVEQLKPLAIPIVSLAPGHVVQLPSVDQNRFDALGFQHFVKRDPVDRSAFHDHRRHSLLPKPVHQLFEVICSRSEYPHIGCPVGIRRTADPVLPTADIDARYQRADRGERLHISALILLAGLSTFHHVTTSSETRASARGGDESNLTWGSARRRKSTSLTNEEQPSSDPDYAWGTMLQCDRGV